MNNPTTNYNYHKLLSHNGRMVKPLASVDGNSLLEMEFEPLKYVVEEWLPTGTYLIGGAPKSGKSFLMMQLSIAVATGNALWNFQTSKGRVLYFALEDTYRRLHLRLSSIEEPCDLSNLHFITMAEKVKDGLLVQINDYIDNFQDTLLVIIDTIHYVREKPSGKHIYAEDYELMTQLKTISDSRDVALILVTHTRKEGDDDPINMITGTTGMTGGGDGNFVLQKRKGVDNGAILAITNRDTPSYEFLLEFDSISCQWNLVKRDENSRESDPLVNALLTFLSDKKNWQGSATELLRELKAIESSLSHTPATLSRRMSNLINTLGSKGVRFKNGYKGKCRIITLMYSVPM